MADQVSITGTVQSDSKERVAYDLMKLIANNESGVNKDRRYFLQLYSQCHQVARGWGIDDVTPKP